MSTYLDTSALAKWYLPEVGSDDFESWFSAAKGVFSSTLVRLEFHSMVSRRNRLKELTAVQAAKVLATFEHDILSGTLVFRAVSDSQFVSGQYLFDRCSGAALRTLDALHLSIALDNSAAEIATADVVMAEAAKKLGLKVKFFGPTSHSVRRK